MYSLMQPIKRPKHIDPVTYNSKVEFWNELILQYAETERVLVVTQNTLQLAFSRYFQEEGITLGPQCLNEVFEHLKIKQLLQLCDNRAITLGSLLWEGMSYLLKKPVSFAWDWLLG